MSNWFAKLPRYPSLMTALVAFVLYLSMMGGGLTVGNLALASRLAGWSELPPPGHPLLWLLTLPLQALPAAWIPAAVKWLAAALGAAILGLLMRTVQLLPWDHPWTGTHRWVAVLPGLTAVVVCGLEWAFWQAATTSCGDLLDLLLLSAAIWLMLEHRVRHPWPGLAETSRQSGAVANAAGLNSGPSRWLQAATLFWGIGLADDWAMLVTLPLFLAGLVWLLRDRILRWSVFKRLTLLGLAGGSLYVLMPMVNGLTPHSPWTLGQAWRASFHQTGQVISMFHQLWRGNWLLLVAMAIYYAVPTLPLLVRLRDEGTHHKFGVDLLQLWLYRYLRLGLLLACFGLAFDPGLAWGKWLPALSLVYVNALGSAFLLGNLLLASQAAPAPDDYPRPRWRFPWGRFVPAAAAASLLLVAAGLAARNGPAIWRTNAHSLEEFGRRALASLPPGGGLILSDAPDMLAVFQSAAARQGRAADWLAVEVPETPTLAYRTRLNRRQPGVWLNATNRHDLSPAETLQLWKDIARTQRLFYLHPGFGYIFEGFYSEPEGSVYELIPRGDDPIAVPPLPASVTAANEKFWTEAWDRDLAGLTAPVQRPRGWRKTLAHYGFSAAPCSEDRTLGSWFSLAVDGWAVALQKQGRWREARTRLEEARQLNTNNVSAGINLRCNTNIQAGIPARLLTESAALEAMGGEKALELATMNDGPLDDPSLDFILGKWLLNRGMWVQAAEQMQRSSALAPGALDPQLALANIYNLLRLPARSRPLLQHLRAATQRMPDNRELDLELSLLEAGLFSVETNQTALRLTLDSLLERYPDDSALSRRVADAYQAAGDWTNALKLADADLARTPNLVPALNKKALLLMQCGREAEAIPLFDHILEQTNLPAVRENRAFAHLARLEFAPAESDLRELEKSSHPSPTVEMGLAKVAEFHHDTNQAVQYWRQCLTNSLAGGPLREQAGTRLQALGSGPPAR